MAKNYIYQLLGGKMLVYQDGWVGVETVSGSLPDCSLTIGGTTLRRKDDILRAILGYDIEDVQAFSGVVSEFSPMPFDEFKYRVQTGNIGGGCPQRILNVAKACKTGLGYNQALFKNILPECCIDDACSLPSEDDIKAEYGEILGHSWTSKLHTPDWRFKNNIILFTGLKKIGDKHFELLQDVASLCMVNAWRRCFQFMVGITLRNGNGAMLLTDSYVKNCDIAFLYQRVTLADLGIGKIVIDIDETGSFEAKYKYLESVGKKLPRCHGVVERRILM